jgi:predicted RNA methylase
MNTKKQFKRDTTQNSNKLHLDQYYTPDDVAQHCIDTAFGVIGKDNISCVIEPSAGTGVFSSKIKNCIAYDIEPKADGIVQADFLSLDIPYTQGTLVIGNPPFGSRGNLMQKFCKHSFTFADHVAFILPVNQLNNTTSIYEFDLIHSEDIGVKDYSGRKVHCCFNMYKRPENGLNSKPNYKTDVIEVREVREVIKNQNPKRNKELGDFQYDIAICAWGAIGKECSVGQYAKTFYIKIKDTKYFEYYKSLILNAAWCNIYKMTGTPNLLQWQLYKYVKENPPTGDMKRREYC